MRACRMTYKELRGPGSLVASEGVISALKAHRVIAEQSSSRLVNVGDDHSNTGKEPEAQPANAKETVPQREDSHTAAHQAKVKPASGSSKSADAK
ncbi:hypothetical protein PC121_g12282 [Phytophthora cactorum]|nr:hypothetical protein PC120_g12850 [Phytophthora cactorum]KAG3063202.1 hypothetical protein PC121_g12282 [Phytophthora cactorum]